MSYAKSEETYRTPERKRTKLDEEARKFIEDWLEENKRRILARERKQCIDMQEVWRLLTEEKGYTLSYPSVTAYARDYVARMGASGQSKSRECFIRQYHPAGEECQFDWDDVKLVIKGKKITVRMAAFALPHSNNRRGYLFLREHTLAFQESHRNYFRDTGHIPLRMVYVDMKVAVKSFVGDKAPTDALVDMSNFYGFQFRFCNARSGNEKGNVEETVKVLRKAAFSVRYKFDSLEEAQQYLDKVSDRLNNCTAEIIRLSAEDFSAMKVCTEDFACFQLIERKADKYSVIEVENVHYSVPDRFAQSTVSVRNYTNKIEILEAGKVAAMHEKADGRDVWCIKLEHYLNTLSYKPGALKNAEALRQAPEGLQRIFKECIMSEPKSFILLLQYALDRDCTFNDVIEAYESLKRKRVKSVTLSLLESELAADTHEVSILLPGCIQGSMPRMAFMPLLPL